MGEPGEKGGVDLSIYYFVFSVFFCFYFYLGGGGRVGGWKGQGMGVLITGREREREAGRQMNETVALDEEETERKKEGSYENVFRWNRVSRDVMMALCGSQIDLLGATEDKIEGRKKKQCHCPLRSYAARWAARLRAST